MNRLIFSVALLLFACSLLQATTNPATQQLLASAEQKANLFGDRVGPIELDVDFAVQMNVPMQGHLTFLWMGKDRWRRSILLGDFEEVEVRNGDKLYTSRNIGFTPVRIGELISLLQFAEETDDLVVRKQKERVQNGTEMTCLQVQHNNFKSRPHEVCLDAASHDILSDEWQEPPDERRREQYSDYFDFEGHRYPRRLQLHVNGSTVIMAHVQNLTPTSFDQEILVPPKGAIERRQCADMKHAVAVKTPDPIYPKSASQNQLMGDTTVAMTVLTDGSVTNIQLVGSAGRSMDDATLQTLKSWRFKPAMCGTEPVVSDIEVVVSFRLE